MRQRFITRASSASPLYNAQSYFRPKRSLSGTMNCQSPVVVVSGRSFSTTPSSPVKLHTEWLQAGDSKAVDENVKNENDRYYSILFLHGLLGNGRNLKTFARQIVKQRNPLCHGGILMDLPGHGKSYNNEEGPAQQKRTFTFLQCVKDVEHTLQELHQEQAFVGSAPTDVLVGHSWGGRLALEYAAAASANGTPLQTLWLLDTVPGQAHESVDRVIAAVSSVVKEGSMDRKELVQTLIHAHGLDQDLAQWLASSYNSKTGDFGFDLDLVQGLKPEFAHQDFVGLLRIILEKDMGDSSTKKTQVHLVRGGKNTAWSVEILSELERLARQFPKTFHLHVLPTAGHWVHADDLPGLVALFDRHS